MMHQSSKKILLIEDDAVTRNLFLDLLGSMGFQAIGAENGLIGIQQAQRYLPDLIICDIMMPNLDGYSVLNILRQDPLTAIIPFIFLTGSDTKASIRKGMELGADDYLTKPISMDELLNAIAIRLEKQSLLRYWYATHADSAAELPEFPGTPELTLPRVPQLQEVFDFIEAHYHQGITLADVAQAVGYSPAYLTNQVAKRTGDTVNAWIVKRRMAAARPLLKDTNQSIEQIAAKLGYQNTCYFSRQFRQHHGISPNVWRKQHQPSYHSVSIHPQISQIGNSISIAG
jgi:YesN/AraC family two-component response regulator